MHTDARIPTRQTMTDNESPYLSRDYRQKFGQSPRHHANRSSQAAAPVTAVFPAEGS